MATSKNTFSWEDPFNLNAQLTDDERAVRDAAHAYCQERLAPRVMDAFLNRSTSAPLGRISNPLTPTSAPGHGASPVPSTLTTLDIYSASSRKAPETPHCPSTRKRNGFSVSFHTIPRVNLSMKSQPGSLHRRTRRP